VIGIVAVGGALAIATGLRGAYAPNSRLFGPVIGRGPRRRVAFLTFDDGPNPGVTERILAVLTRERVPATFFMVGKHVERYPDTARAVAHAGHEIGNHTYSHLKLHRVGPRRAAEEVRRGHDTIAEITGVIPRSFRAPHGYRSPFVTRAIAPYEYRVFGWTFGVWDTARPGAEQIRSRIKAGLRPGSILLLHDGDGYQPLGNRWQTADALQGIITDVKARGYRFAPLAELAEN
jgi:peptidoglycan/xylan/chitin deacetylase (PgdA/CDA1 family)